MTRDVVPPGEERVDEMRPDEPRPARDQHVHDASRLSPGSDVFVRIADVSVKTREGGWRRGRCRGWRGRRRGGRSRRRRGRGRRRRRRSGCAARGRRARAASAARERIDVAVGDEAGDAVEHDLGRAPDARRDRRAADALRLDERHRHPLVVGRQQRQVGGRVDRLDVGAPARGTARGRRVARPARRISARRSPSPATTKHTSGRACATRAATSTKRSGRFTRVSRATNATTGRTGRQPERGARRVTRRRRRQRDTRRHHHVLVRAADPRREQLVAHLAADGDEARRHVRERPLDGRDRARHARREVPVEQVAVEGVDPDRHPGEHRRAPAQDARLRGVRVDDVRAELADLADEGGEGPRVTGRVGERPRPWTRVASTCGARRSR